MLFLPFGDAKIRQITSLHGVWTFKNKMREVEFLIFHGQNYSFAI